MLSVSERKLGTVAVFCLEGRIIVGEMASLRKSIAGLTGVKTLLLDLSRVSMIDAAGLGLLLELRQELRKKRIQLRLMNVAERINRLLEITRLNTVFDTASFAAVLPVSRLTNAVSQSKLAPCA